MSFLNHDCFDAGEDRDIHYFFSKNTFISIFRRKYFVYLPKHIELKALEYIISIVKTRDFALLTRIESIARSRSS